MTQNAPLKTAQVKKPPARSAKPDITPKLERSWFEFDRRTVLSEIDRMQKMLDENAKQLGMVAVEGVFEKPLSDGLLRASRALRTTAKELIALRRLVERTSHNRKPDKKKS